MSIAIPIVIYVICFAAIITFQILALKKEGKLFFILSFATGIISSVISMIMTTYYGTVIDRLKSEATLMSMDAADQIPTYQGYTIICLAVSIMLFASILLTGVLILVKHLYLSKK